MKQFVLFSHRAALVVALVFLSTPAHGQEAALLTAAEQGDVSAQIQLGYGFRDGTFGRKDAAQAFTWFSRAVKTGNPEAVDNLAWLLEHGLGCPADAAKARDLYRQAADAKHPQAMRNLARCSREGLGGAVDTAEALRWSLSAWKLEPNPRSAVELASTLLVQESLAPHTELLDQLATAESWPTCRKLGRIYFEGHRGLAKNADKARELYAKAQRLGMPKDTLDPFQIEALAARRAASGQFVFLTTRHLDQGFNMCAPTSAAMALEFILQQPVDPYAIKNASIGATRPGTGTAWDCLLKGIRTVTEQTWEFRSWPNDNAGFEAGLPVLLGELDAHRVALIDLGPHTVVLCGYDAKERAIYINNPAIEWPGIQSVSYDALRERWHSPWHVTTTRGIEARPVLLTGAKAN